MAGVEAVTEQVSGPGEDREWPLRGSDDRRSRLRLNLEIVRRRVVEVARLAGRGSDEVELLVVTKTWPASDVRILWELGQPAVGENRVRELARKKETVDEAGLRWHLVGGLQTNKAALAAATADEIESVDRESLVDALSAVADRQGRVVDCLMQVSLDAQPIPGRSGVRPERARKLADLIASRPGLRLRGVMGVGPNPGNPRKAFDRLVEVADVVRTGHPEARTISAGMSSDYVAAIEAGATRVRIGTAVLGDRSSLG